MGAGEGLWFESSLGPGPQGPRQAPAPKGLGRVGEEKALPPDPPPRELTASRTSTLAPWPFVLPGLNSQPRLGGLGGLPPWWFLILLGCVTGTG